MHGKRPGRPARKLLGTPRVSRTLLIEIDAAAKKTVNEEGRRSGVPNSFPFCRVPTVPASRVVLGERWFAVQDQHLLGASCLRGERVVLVLEPH
jgi:hypothetical protein